MTCHTCLSKDLSIRLPPPTKHTPLQYTHTHRHMHKPTHALCHAAGTCTGHPLLLSMSHSRTAVTCVCHTFTLTHFYTTVPCMGHTFTLTHFYTTVPCMGHTFNLTHFYTTVPCMGHTATRCHTYTRQFHMWVTLSHTVTLLHDSPMFALSLAVTLTHGSFIHGSHCHTLRDSPM